MTTPITVITIIGLIAAQATYSNKDVANAVTPIMHEMVGHQEMNVKMMEDLGMSGASEARAQWDGRKSVANSRIEEFSKLSNQ
tara:strand:- start:1340 stop:1588 length:249 start_codon:yes stop_codon:yes gene_type:complete